MSIIFYRTNGQSASRIEGVNIKMADMMDYTEPGAVIRRYLHMYLLYVLTDMYTCGTLHIPSQRVLKLCILLVRHVEKLLVLNLGISRIRPNQALLVILPPVVPPDESKVNQASAPADQDGDFGGPILWCIFRTESLRSWKGVNMVVSGRCDANIPIMFPTQYATRYIAATVVFLVHPAHELVCDFEVSLILYLPATLVEINDRSATNGVGLA